MPVAMINRLMWKTKTTRSIRTGYDETKTTRSIRTGYDDPTDVKNKDDKKYKNWL